MEGGVPATPAGRPMAHYSHKGPKDTELPLFKFRVAFLAVKELKESKSWSLCVPCDSALLSAFRISFFPTLVSRELDPPFCGLCFSTLISHTKGTKSTKTGKEKTLCATALFSAFRIPNSAFPQKVFSAISCG
jgi:hypothetical protein